MSGVELEFQSNAKSTERDLEALNKQLRSIFSTANTSKTIFPDLAPTLSKNTKAIKNFSREANSAGRDIDRTFGRITNGIQALGLLGPALDTLSAPLKAFKGYGDSVLNLNSKLRLATDSLEEFNKSQSDVKGIAKDTKSSLGDIGTSYAGLALVLKDKGFNGDALTELTASITKAAKLGGGPIDSINAALFQLRQGLGADALRGEELNSIIEQTPYLANILRKGLGMTTSEMRKAAAAGELTAATVANAITSMTDQIDKDFSKLAVTSEVGAKRFEGALSNMLGELNVALGISENSGKFLLKLADKIEASTPTMIAAITNLKDRLRSKFNEFKFEIPLLLEISKDFVFDKLQKVAGALDVNIDFDVSIDALKNLFEELSITAKNGLSRSLTYVNDFSVKVRRAFFEIYDEVIGHSWWPDTIDGVVEKTKDLDGVLSSVKDFGKNIGGQFADVFSKVDSSSVSKLRDSLALTLADVELKDVFEKIGNSLIVGIAAALAVTSASPVFNAIGGLLTIGLLSGPIEKSVELFGNSLALTLGNVAETIGVEVARGIQTGLNSLFKMMPGFVHGFVEELSPLPDTITDLFLSVTPLTNSAFSSLLALSAGLAVVSKDFRKMANTAILGKPAKGAPGDKGFKAAEPGLLSLVTSVEPGALARKLFPTSLQKTTASIGAALLSTALLESVALFDAGSAALPFVVHAFLGGDLGAESFRKIQFWVVGTIKKLLDFNIIKILTEASGGYGPQSPTLKKISEIVQSLIGNLKKLKKMTVNTFKAFGSNFRDYMAGNISLRDAFKSSPKDDGKSFGDLDFVEIKDALKKGSKRAWDNFLGGTKDAFTKVKNWAKDLFSGIYDRITKFGKGLASVFSPTSFVGLAAIFSGVAFAGDAATSSTRTLTSELLILGGTVLLVGNLVERYVKAYRSVAGVQAGFSAASALMGADLKKLGRGLRSVLSLDTWKKWGNSARSVLATVFKGGWTAAAVATGGLLVGYLFGKRGEISKRISEIADEIREAFGGTAKSQRGRVNSLFKDAEGLKISGSDLAFRRQLESKDLSSLDNASFDRHKAVLDSSYKTLVQLEEQRLENGSLTLDQVKEQEKVLLRISRILNALPDNKDALKDTRTLLPRDPSQSLGSLIGVSYEIDDATNTIRKFEGVWGSFGLNRKIADATKQVGSVFTEIKKRSIEGLDKSIEWVDELSIAIDTLFSLGFSAIRRGLQLPAPRTPKVEANALNTYNKARSTLDNLQAEGILSPQEAIAAEQRLGSLKTAILQFQETDVSDWKGTLQPNKLQEALDELMAKTTEFNRDFAEVLTNGANTGRLRKTFKEYSDFKLEAESLGVKLPENLTDKTVADRFLQYAPTLKSLKEARRGLSDSLSTDELVAENDKISQATGTIKDALIKLSDEYSDSASLAVRWDKVLNVAGLTEAQQALLSRFPGIQTSLTKEAEALQGKLLKLSTVQVQRAILGEITGQDRSIDSAVKDLKERIKKGSDELASFDKSIYGTGNKDAFLFRNKKAKEIGSLNESLANLPTLPSLKIGLEFEEKTLTAETEALRKSLRESVSKLPVSFNTQNAALQKLNIEMPPIVLAKVDQNELTKRLENALQKQTELTDLQSQPGKADDAAKLTQDLVDAINSIDLMKVDALRALLKEGRAIQGLEALGQNITDKGPGKAIDDFDKKLRGKTDAERMSFYSESKGLSIDKDLRALSEGDFNSYIAMAESLQIVEKSLGSLDASVSKAKFDSLFSQKMQIMSDMASLESDAIVASIKGAFDTLSSSGFSTENLAMMDTRDIELALRYWQEMQKISNDMSKGTFNAESLRQAANDLSGLSKANEALKNRGATQDIRSDQLANALPGVESNVLKFLDNNTFKEFAKSIEGLEARISTDGMTPNLEEALKRAAEVFGSPEYQAAILSSLSSEIDRLDVSAIKSRLEDVIGGPLNAAQGNVTPVLAELERIRLNTEKGFIQKGEGAALSKDIISKRFGTGAGLRYRANQESQNGVGLSNFTTQIENLTTSSEKIRYEGILKGMQSARDSAGRATTDAGRIAAQNDYDMLLAAWEDGMRTSSESLGRLSMEAGFRFRDTVFSSFREGLSGLMKGDASFKDTLRMLADRFTGGIIDSFVDGLVSSLEKTDLSGLLTRLGKGQFDLGTIFGGSEFANQQTAGATLQTAGISLNTAAMSLQAAAGMMSGQNGLGMLGDVSGMFGQSSSFDKAIETAVTPSFESVTNGFDNVLSTADMGFKGVTDSATETFGANGPLPGLFEGAFGSTGFLGDIIGGLGRLLSDGATGIADGVGAIAGVVGSLFMADGGHVSGRGTSKSDSIPAMLSNGEFVVNAAATAKNRALLEAINKGRVPKFADGGIVKSSSAVSKEFSNRSSNNSSSSVTKIDLGITGDISRQTRAEVMKMLPELAQGVNMFNKERNVKRR
jgi:tape measure domain-containing protein